MRTLILSDLHLGNGGGYDIHGGGAALPALLDDLPGGVRLIFNGDTVDFLMNEEPLVLERARAVAQARDIAAANGAVFGALGRFLARGGQVEIRLGNHDVELALPEVQAVFRAATGAGLRFATGEAPARLEIGGVPVLYTHGEHFDPFNRVDYAHLLANDLAQFAFPPGSVLVKHTLNPVKRVSGLRFIDLLKPDVQGAFLAALALRPLAFRHLARPQLLGFLVGTLENWLSPLPFEAGETDEPPPPELAGLREALARAGLTADEAGELLDLVDPEGPPLAFGLGDFARRARAKLLRQGLCLYAAAHRALTDESGAAYFDTAPDDGEWTEARRLAETYGARVVVMGHTHAARFRDEGGLCYLNTGTWAWLMALPDAGEPVETWADFLAALDADPGLEDPSGVAIGHRRAVLTWAELTPVPGGLEVALRQWAEGGPVTRGHRRITR